MEIITSQEKFFMREKESKYETYYFMKVATNVMFTHMYAKAGIKNFWEISVVAMINEPSKIEKCPMPGKPVVTTINPDTL